MKHVLAVFLIAKYDSLVVLWHKNHFTENSYVNSPKSTSPILDGNQNTKMWGVLPLSKNGCGVE
jgi:hypothetical protein